MSFTRQYRKKLKSESGLQGRFGDEPAPPSSLSENRLAQALGTAPSGKKDNKLRERDYKPRDNAKTDRKKPYERNERQYRDKPRRENESVDKSSREPVHRPRDNRPRYRDTNTKNEKTRSRSRSPERRQTAPAPYKGGSFSVKYASSPPILQIRNLEKGTSAEDVKTVVESVGPVLECRVKDASVGAIAEIMFNHAQDAEQARDTFHNTLADGRQISAQILREYSIKSGSYMTYSAPAPSTNDRREFQSRRQ